jgi:hypothetical protein
MSVPYQQIPVVVPHLMTKVAEQGAVGFTPLQPTAFPLDIVGLVQRDRDCPVVVPCHDLGTFGRVRWKVEDQTMLRILLPGSQRQLPTDETVNQAGAWQFR